MDIRRIQRQTSTQRRMFFFDGVLYFGWPNQPFSGTMGILHWDVFLCRIRPEIRKTN